MFEHARLLALPIGVLSALAMMAAAPAAAQAPNLAGRNVTMLIGFGPGGGYDQWGRVVARHIGKHLPGKPNVVPQNMPGGGSFNAANHIYNVAPKDGTVMGIIARDAPLGPLSGMAGARFDPLKMTWLGTPTTETNVCFMHNRSKVKTLRRSSSARGDHRQHRRRHRHLYLSEGAQRTPRRQVQDDLRLPLVVRRHSRDGSRRGRRRLRKLRQRLQQAARLVRQGRRQRPVPGRRRAESEYQDAPFLFDLIKNPEHKQALEYLYAGQGIGRPFIAPPGMTPEVTKMVRDAFMATMKDPQFIADAKKGKLDVDPEDGAKLEALIRRIYATPKHLVDQVGQLIK